MFSCRYCSLFGLNTADGDKCSKFMPGITEPKIADTHGNLHGSQESVLQPDSTPTKHERQIGGIGQQLGAREVFYWQQCSPPLV
jgi:hypothetical protein